MMNQDVTLEKAIDKIGRKIAHTQGISNRYALIRFVVIVLGGVATWAGASYLEYPWGWITFAGTILLFAVVALIHRGVDDWQTKFELWRDIKCDHLARLNLAWDQLPKPSIQDNRSAVEIDLDLSGPKSLHHLLDTTITKQGSQQLRSWLTQERPNLEQIHMRQSLVRELLPLRRFRDRLRLTYRLYSEEVLDGEKLLNWLKEEFPSERLRMALLFASVLVAANITLFLLHSYNVLPPYWTISLSLYIIFYLTNIGAVSKFLEAVVDLDREISKFAPLLHYLEEYPLENAIQLSQLCSPFRDPRDPPSRQLMRVKWITAGVGMRMNPVLSLIVNLICPWDFIFAALAARARQLAARTFPGWLDVWYQLEALISLANFAALNPDYTFPDIIPTGEPGLEANELGHPLLPQSKKICNDFVVDSVGQIILITGSNMAGKSTFIKMVGVNLCLAYAGAPVNATYLRTIAMRLHTCIRIRDSLTDGYSYFYAEVKCLKSLLDKLIQSDDMPVLYLVDEIFRGTNNRERLSGSRAYLRSASGKNGVGLLATHDLELAGLAEESQFVRNYHFRDQVLDGKLTFDYKIRPGPSPTTNALKIMQMEGLPVEGV